VRIDTIFNVEFLHVATNICMKSLQILLHVYEPNMAIINVPFCTLFSSMSDILCESNHIFEKVSQLELHGICKKKRRKNWKRT